MDTVKWGRIYLTIYHPLLELYSSLASFRYAESMMVLNGEVHLTSYLAKLDWC